MASLPESVSENLPGRDNLVRGEFLHELREKPGKRELKLLSVLQACERCLGFG